MPAPGAAGPSKRAYTVAWRNFQGKKNKTWENDGIMLVEGTGVTVYSMDGKLLGARNVNKPIEEDDEFNIGRKDVKVNDQCTLDEYYQVAGRKGGQFGVAAAVSTPAKAVPGYLVRPDHAVTANGRGTSPLMSPVVAPPSSAEAHERGETPVPGASKSWIQPRDKLQKPFKMPGRSPATASVSAGAARNASPAPSKLRERAVPEQARRATGLGSEEPVRPSSAKGKEHAEDDLENLENSPPSLHFDQPRIAKKPRLESVRSPVAAAVARPARRSAADAAFDFAVSKQRRNSVDRPPSPSRELARAPPARTKSAPDWTEAQADRNVRAQPLFRSSASPEKHKQHNVAPKQKEEWAAEEDPAWLQDMDLDAEIFANDSTSAQNDESPRARAGSILSSGDEDFEGSDAGSSSFAEDADVEVVGFSSGIRSEQKRLFNCLWRKVTTAKKADWAGDARLIVTGQSARLIDEANGKQLAAWTVHSDADLLPEKVMTFCGVQFQIQDAVDDCTSRLSRADPAAPKRAKPAPQAPPLPPTSRPTAFKPPAPAKAVNPLARQFAARSASPAPLPPRPAREAASIALPPAAVVDFFGKPRSTGVSSGRRPGPLFDPGAEGALVMRRPDESHQAEYNKANAPIVDVVVDPIISAKLREHQRIGVAFLYECVMGMRSSGQGCILADDMGLGKTIQSIALVWTLLKQNPYQFGSHGTIRRAMIVCPVTLIKNWSQEFKKWLGKDRVRVIVGDSKQAIETFMYSKNYEVLIVGYEKVREHVELLKAAQPPVGLVICDEGHRLKSDKTKTSQALQSLSCMRRVILSGTPIQNNLGEFFAMLDFVNPGILQDAEYFKKNFERPIMAARQPDATSRQRQEGAEAQETLATIRSHFVLRRENSVILQHLPPKYEYTVFVRPTELQLSVYREALGGSVIKTMLEGFDVKTGLSVLQTLLKLATSPGLLLKQIEENGFGRLEKSIIDAFPSGTDSADFAISGKLTVLGAMLAGLWKNNVEKIVVVSNYTSTLDLIETHCKHHKYPYCRLDGKTPQQDRIPMVEAFNRGPRSRNFVFLLSSKGGGTGLNIIGASRLVQIDSDWNPSNDLQAMARIHREGQTRVCVIYRFLTSGTVDEVIYQRQLTKLALSGAIMAGEGAAASSKHKNTFTADELRNLFTLHEDVACQTHDLLGCRCHLGEGLPDEPDPEEDDGNSESGDDDFEGGFVQASQYQDKDAKRDLARTRRDLSVLKTWAHYSARDLTRMDQVEDPLLLSVFYRALEQANPDESLPKLRDQDEDLCGGQIAFVFGQKAVAPVPPKEGAYA
ncbi:hypothetical protein JCM3774_006594 [Rhodotorula dairenensis]